jgi:hypothetical protein
MAFCGFAAITALLASWSATPTAAPGHRPPANRTQEALTR